MAGSVPRISFPAWRTGLGMAYWSNIALHGSLPTPVRAAFQGASLLQGRGGCTRWRLRVRANGVTKKKNESRH